VSRPYRLIIWLAGIIALLGVTYACLPMVVAGLVKHTLSARGLSDVQVNVGYPGWRGIRFDKLQFTAIAGEQHIFCQLTDADVEYHITELLAGTVARIRVPVAVARLHPAPDIAPSVQTIAALPLAALVSGQWLSQLPVRELLLEQLTVNWRTPSDAVYTIHLTGNIRDAEAQVSGEINLPTPQRNQAAFSFIARKTGEARLLLSPSENSAEPMLELAVNKVSIDQNQIEVNGVLNTKLNTLVPMLEPWLAVVDWTSGLEGDFKSQWQAVLPRESPDDEVRRTLQPLHGNGSNWQVVGEARVHDLSGRWREQQLPRGELYAKFESDPQRATVQTTLSAADHAVVLEANWLHQFTTGNGHADLKLVPVVFTDSGFVLSQLLEHWPYSFDITSGRLSGTGRMVWQTSRSADASRQRALDQKLFLHLDKIGGRYKEVTFQGLSTEATLANGDVFHTTKEAQLSVDLLDVGFPIENIDVRFQLASDPKRREAIVRIQKFATELLGGRAHSEPFQFDFGRDKNQFMVQLEQISLNDIMKLEQQEGLQGTGVLDGQLPIEITREGIEVRHGQLSVRAPGGDIRYLPTEKVLTLAQANPSVKMIVEALSNFQYDVLDVISDYKPEGDLTLQIHLEGKNPDWQSGQPVHLNLNLEENIPALLRSLQLSDEITERVRKSYQNTP
jgi:hypothetical protein